MKERPILFSAEMARAILEGRKSQTRRVVRPQPMNKFGPLPSDMYAYCPDAKHPDLWAIESCGEGVRQYESLTPFSRADGVEYWRERCPYGHPGDRLWVRETWRAEELESGLDGVRYAADDFFRPIENTSEAAEAWGEAAFDKHGKSYGMTWRPSIFMPRWASRITLEVVKVQVERVQDISEADAWAEGITVHAFGARAARFTYEELWDKINAKRGFGWNTNPWVWVVGFGRVG